MKSIGRILAATFAVIFVASVAWASTITSNGSGGGTWATGATWLGGTAPVAGDDVIIAGTDIVTLGAAASCTNCTVNTGGTLDAATFVLTVSATFTLQSGATFRQGGTVTAAPGATRAFDNASTFVYYGGQTSITGNFTFGNLTWNSTSNGTPSGNLQVNGNLSLIGGTALRGSTGSTLRTHTVVGNVVVNGSGTGCQLVGSNGTANGTWNIGGNVTISGQCRVIGNTSSGTTGIGTFNIDGNLIVNSSLATIEFGSNAGCSGQGIINLKGNLQNDGKIWQNLGTGSLSINFVGTSAQGLTTPGTTGFITAFSTATLNMTVNNAAGVTLGMDVPLNGTLTLTSGTLTVGANKLTLQNPIAGTPGNLSAGSTSSIVIAGSASGINIPSSVSALRTFTLNNSNGTTLQGTLTVGDTITLSSGNVALNGQILTLGTAIAFPGALTYTSGFLTGTGTFTRWFASSAIAGNSGLFPMGVGSNNRALEIGGSPSTGGPIAVSYNDASTVSAITFTENVQDFVNRYDANWVAIPSGGYTDGAMTLTIHGDGIPGITAVADLDLSAASVIALGVWASPSGTTSAPVLTRNGLTQGTIVTNPFYIASVATSPLPVEMTSFTAKANRLTAELHWTTATEANNFGFEIERKTSATGWAKVGFVSGVGTSNSLNKYSYVDNTVEPGLYEYRIKQVDKGGSFKYSSVMQVELGMAPKVLSLGDNYPNPFNPSTSIEFSVPTDGRAALKVYNMLGQEVATLFDGVATAGKLMKVTFDASRLSSGVYFSRLEVGGNALVKRMLLMK